MDNSDLSTYSNCFDGGAFGNDKIIRSIDVFYKSLSQDVFELTIDQTNSYEEQRYVQRLIHLLHISPHLQISAHNGLVVPH